MTGPLDQLTADTAVDILSNGNEDARYELMVALDFVTPRAANGDLSSG